MTPGTIPRRSIAGCLAALALAAGITAACGGPSSPGAPSPVSSALTPVPQTAEWPASTPGAESLNTAPLEDLVGRIRHGDYGFITSLLVARHGRLVVEEYFNGWSAAQSHTLQSVSKSVTSLLTGIAVQQGRLRVDDRVVPLMPQYQPIANLDDRKASMTVRDLLTMRTGFDWSESSYAGSPLQRMNDCGCDWLRFVLDWPMADRPGTRWEYVSGGVILLGGVVGAATGQRIDLFADDQLFGPLGVQRASWFRGLPDSLPHTGGGLNMRPRDVAKLGTLVLDDGRWQGRQVVSASWIRESTQRIVHAPRTLGGHAVDYGYLWWILDLADRMNPRPEPGDIITASGARGQWIFVVPRYDLVMITTAQNSGFDEGRPTDFLYTHILAAVR